MRDLRILLTKSLHYLFWEVFNLFDIRISVIKDRVYFLISDSKDIYVSAGHEIATLLGIQTKYYNEILIEKVI